MVKSLGFREFRVWAIVNKLQSRRASPILQLAAADLAVGKSRRAAVAIAVATNTTTPFRV